MAVEPYAPAIYKALNGVFCIYKPAGKTLSQTIYTLQMKLSRELNRLPCRPLRQRVLIGNTATTSDVAVAGAAVNDVKDSHLPSITTVDDLADHPLVAGSRYINEDFELSSVSPLDEHSSGVQVMGIGHGCSKLQQIETARYLRAYHVQGQFGTATHNFMPDGDIIERTTYKHVRRALLDRIIAALQAGHQKYMFTAAGVDIQSQKAYELACQGLLRPATHDHPASSGPVLYDIRCIQFRPPDFTLEIHAANETCTYLTKLIHEIGLELRTTAVCTGLRRIRYGWFGLDHALLMKHCDSQSIVENIEVCRSLVKEAWQRLHSRNDIIQRTDGQYLQQTLDGDEFQELTDEV